LQPQGTTHDFRKQWNGHIEKQSSKVCILFLSTISKQGRLMMLTARSLYESIASVNQVSKPIWHGRLLGLKALSAQVTKLRFHQTWRIHV